jgi:anti-anti-sigma factor
MNERSRRWKLGDGEAGVMASICIAVQVDRSTIASVRGDFDTEAAPVVTRQLLALLAKPIESLTVDLSEVTFMDSAGLGVLTVVRNHAEHAGVRFTLRDSSRYVEQVLRAAGMVDYFATAPAPDPDGRPANGDADADDSKRPSPE